MTTALLEPPQVRQFDMEILDDAPKSLDIASLGGELKLIGRATRELTIKWAEELIDMPVLWDRPMEDQWVAKLVAAMKRGTFLPEQVNIVTCTFGGKEYRMNGQHTSWARLAMPEDYRCPVTHYRYKAETENDMRRLYATIDRAKARTSGNIVVSYLFGTPEWKGYSKAVLTKLSEGLAYWLCETAHQRQMRDADDRAYLMRVNHLDLAKKVGQFITDEAGESARHILRRPVIGAMFATFNKAAAPAREFWQAVRDGVGFVDKHDPRLTLRNGLLSASISLGIGAQPDRKSVAVEEMHRWCLNAWNAWRRGDQLKILKAVLGCERPKVI